MEANEVLEAVPHHHAHNHAGGEGHPDPQAPFRSRASIAAGLFAIILALCNMGGASRAREGLLLSIKANDTWAWSQAKAARLHEERNFATLLTTTLSATPNLPTDLRSQAEAQLARSKQDAQRYNSDPQTGEGRTELAASAAKLEAERDASFKRQEIFEFAEVLLQVAVVLAGLSAVALSRLLLGIAASFGLVGSLITANGFFLGIALPFL